MIRRNSLPSRSSNFWLRSLAIITVLLFAYTRFYCTIPYPNYNCDGTPKCTGLQSGSNIVVAVKTGGSEAATKIPPLMETSLRCAPNVYIFSDLEQDIGPYHIRDALDQIPQSMVEENVDFQYYTKQKLLWESKKDLRELQGVKHPVWDDELAAWVLDKYKFLHVLEKTWAMHPDADWYFLIDADTYLVWQNMLVWLSDLDPSIPSYFGSAVIIGKTPFAHGGTGIVLSGAAMELLVNNGTAARWNERTEAHCCGDYVLGRALLEDYGVPITDVWPWMSGERTVSMPFGAGTPEYWCRPAMSFHHMTPKDMYDLAEFEGKRQNLTKSMTHAELFHDFVQPALPSSYRAYNWNNEADLAGEYGRAGGVPAKVDTFDECTVACKITENCMQYSWHNQTCFLGMSVRLGYKKKADEGGVWRSGWHKDHLMEWVANQPSCGKIWFPPQHGVEYPIQDHEEEQEDEKSEGKLEEDQGED